jgi:hypothetical protein
MRWPQKRDLSSIESVVVFGSPAWIRTTIRASYGESVTYRFRKGLECRNGPENRSLVHNSYTGWSANICSHPPLGTCATRCGYKAGRGWKIEILETLPHQLLAELTSRFRCRISCFPVGKSSTSPPPLLVSDLSRRVRNRRLRWCRSPG